MSDTPSTLTFTPWWMIATWFGCGLSPLVSGTVGSLGALPFAYAIQYFYGNSGLFIASVLMFFVGWWASNKYLVKTGCAPDPKQIVADEVAGQWLLLAFLPLSWQGYLLGFVLFRAFDIIKPWPVSVADEKIGGGFGVMADDILAALYPPAVYSLLALLGFGNLLQPVIDFLAAY